MFILNINLKFWPEINLRRAKDKRVINKEM